MNVALLRRRPSFVLEVDYAIKKVKRMAEDLKFIEKLQDIKELEQE